jgi:hypothetical protein
LLIVFWKIDKLTLLNVKLINTLPLSGDARIQGKEEKGRDIDSLQKTISI